MVVLVLLGCHPCPPLGVVPVRGGTSAEQATVGDELSILAQALALDVCVNHVRLTNGLNADRAGTYDPITHGVRIRGGLEDGLLRESLRHEVCHGVDLQNDLVDGREALFPYPDPPDVRKAHLPNEAFAFTCELGREALVALDPGVACDDDPDLRGARFVREEVYGAREPEPGARLEPVASVAWADVLPEDVSREEIDAIGIEAGTDHARLVVTVSSTEDAWRFAVDARTGEPLPEDGASATPSFAAPDDAPPGWTPMLPHGGTSSDDFRVVSGILSLPMGSVVRLHARVDGSWRAVDGPCPWDVVDFFSFGDELWSAGADDARLAWGRWVPLR